MLKFMLINKDFLIRLLILPAAVLPVSDNILTNMDFNMEVS